MLSVLVLCGRASDDSGSGKHVHFNIIANTENSVCWNSVQILLQVNVYIVSILYVHSHFIDFFHGKF